MAKPLIFNREVEKILEFLMVYKLFIRMKMRNNLVEEQVQWVLLYIQGRSANIWKENVIENLVSRNLSYTIVGEFLLDLKEEFDKRDNGIMKVARKQNNSEICIEIQESGKGQ